MMTCGVRGPDWTPLMRAAWEGHARVAELLLTAGADRDKPDGHFRKNS